MPGDHLPSLSSAVRSRHANRPTSTSKAIIGGKYSLWRRPPSCLRRLDLSANCQQSGPKQGALHGLGDAVKS